MSDTPRLLLDTHIWLWVALGTTRKIRSSVLESIEDAAKASGVLVSIVSIWEIALLVARERLFLPLPLHEWIALALARPQIKLVGLSRPATVIDSVNLPGEFHTDPADRFLIATARAQRAVLVTRDEKIIKYSATGHVNVMAA